MQSRGITGVWGTLVVLCGMLALGLALVCSLVWLLGRGICFLLAALTIVMILRSGVPFRTKLVTAAAGFAASAYFYMAAASLRHL
jgi:hypothetical protein